MKIRRSRLKCLRKHPGQNMFHKMAVFEYNLYEWTILQYTDEMKTIQFYGSYMACPSCECLKIVKLKNGFHLTIYFGSSTVRKIM